MKNSIKVRGASTNNLKNVDIDIPINEITSVVGPSGSGKSSLVFHTIVTESKRRFLNSLPNDVKFFWNMPQSASVDSITPVMPVWALAQSNPIIGSRPNASDLFGIFDHIQRFYYHHSKVVCPDHDLELKQDDHWLEVENKINKKFMDSKSIHFFTTKENYRESFGTEMNPSRSFSILDNKIKAFDNEHEYFELFRIKVKDTSKISKKIAELGLKSLKIYFCSLESSELEEAFINDSFSCPKCDFSITKNFIELEQLSPFNAAGACSGCNGHGMKLFYDREKIVKNANLSLEEGALHMLEGKRFGSFKSDFIRECKKQSLDIKKPFYKLATKKTWEIIEKGKGNFPGTEELLKYLETKRYKSSVRIYLRGLQSEKICDECEGSRVLAKSSKLVHFFEGEKISYGYILTRKVKELYRLFKLLKKKNDESDFKVSAILNILETAISIGLENLELSKKAKRLTSSEYQRSLLVKILSYEGSGSLFVLDEPALGLSLKEQQKLFECLTKIKNQGNTILLVEHNLFLIESSNYVIEVGPGAGHLGGEIVSTKQNKKKVNINKFEIIKSNERASKQKLKLENIVVEDIVFRKVNLPLNGITLFYGDKMSYKAKMIKEVIANSLYYHIHKESLYEKSLVIDKGIKNNFENVIVIDSSQGRTTSRSTVGTLLGLSALMRDYFVSLPVSKSLALEKGHFSTNSELGKCTTCDGKGINEVEMNFLEDIRITCSDCGGKKLKSYISNITDGTHTVYEAFNLPISEVKNKLKLTPKYRKILDYLELMNLSYLTLDRTIQSLSGGEKQRIKLITYLEKNIENSLLVFENISSGLSMAELSSFQGIFASLKDRGNTVWVLDQSPFIAKVSDHRINFDV
tara:strand:+ start:256068 stop:258659 length:2592 start_codon:yes stop_codon:yes gene_type:complete